MGNFLRKPAHPIRSHGSHKPDEGPHTQTKHIGVAGMLRTVLQHKTHSELLPCVDAQVSRQIRRLLHREDRLTYRRCLKLLGGVGVRFGSLNNTQKGQKGLPNKNL